MEVFYLVVVFSSSSPWFGEIFDEGKLAEDDEAKLLVYNESVLTAYTISFIDNWASSILFLLFLDPFGLPLPLFGFEFWGSNWLTFGFSCCLGFQSSSWGDEFSLDLFTTLSSLSAPSSVSVFGSSLSSDLDSSCRLLIY